VGRWGGGRNERACCTSASTSTRALHSPVFAKNTSVSRIFGENRSKILDGGAILGKDERVFVW